MRTSRRALRGGRRRCACSLLDLCRHQGSEAKRVCHLTLLPEVVSKLNTIFERREGRVCEGRCRESGGLVVGGRERGLARWLYTRRAPIGPKSSASHSNASTRGMREKIFFPRPCMLSIRVAGARVPHLGSDAPFKSGAGGGGCGSGGNRGRVTKQGGGCARGSARARGSPIPAKSQKNWGSEITTKFDAPKASQFFRGAQTDLARGGNANQRMGIHRDRAGRTS